MKKIYDVKVLRNVSIAKDTYQMDLEAKNIPLEEFRPGRFIHIRIGAGEKHIANPSKSNIAVDSSADACAKCHQRSCTGPWWCY